MFPCGTPCTTRLPETQVVPDDNDDNISKFKCFPRNVNLMNHNLRITLYLGPSTLLGHKNVIHFGREGTGESTMIEVERSGSGKKLHLRFHFSYNYSCSTAPITITITRSFPVLQ